MTRRVLLAGAIGAAAVATFLPVAAFQFLNWDDGIAIVGNSALEFPGAVRWAFTTSLLEHYQPISWLTWAAIKAGASLDPQAFHLANLAAHVVCVLLVWSAARSLLTRAMAGAGPAALDTGATAAAVLFGLHPLRVEVVAWISAFPYALATAFLLAVVLTWLAASSSDDARTPSVPVLLYALSLLARPVALGLPIVVAALDVWLNGRSLRASIRRALPFAILAAVAAIGEWATRAPSGNATPWLYRLQSAASAPFVYLWHTAVPLALTPLDVLPREPQGDPAAAAAAIAALIVVSVAAWSYRHRYRAAAVAWVCYLALLAPTAGLMQSGLQATADRYTYLPGIVVAMAIGGGLAQWSARQAARRSAAAAAIFGAAVACAVASRAGLQPWTNSVSLWSRVVSIDPSNDVGLYNLAAALAADGRRDEAVSRYRQVLAIVPQHADARANLDRLDAARLEGEANDLAASGDLTAAAERYAQALARDPMRTHSHAARGIALATLGEAARAIPELQTAIRQGDDDPAVANALGILLVQSGRNGEARDVFDAAVAKHPNDLNIAHNLARLLVTGAITRTADAERALRLANAVVDATGGRDARALDTLATVLAANGRIADADAVNVKAAAAATAAGDHDLAVQITARRRAYRSPGQ